MSDPAIAQLAKSAQTGDRKAFEQLVQRTARIVYAQIVATIRDRQKAEDLTQETFLAAWKSIASLTDPEGCTTWLLTIARSTVLDHIRSEGRLKRNAKTETTTDTIATLDPSPPETLQQNEAQENALKLLEELPQDYRQPLMMRYLAGADYDTIRTQLNLTDGALRGLLNRGMALLRERMTHSEKRS